MLARVNAYGRVRRTDSEAKWVKPNKRIFNNAKVSDHFAIIPTSQRAEGSERAEAKLYDMVPSGFSRCFIRRRNFW